MMDLPDGEKNLDDMFISFDTIYERDRHTDTAWRQRPRLMLASRGKNGTFWSNFFQHHLSIRFIDACVARRSLFIAQDGKTDNAHSRDSRAQWSMIDQVFIEAFMRCPSVCLSIRLSVTFVYSVKTNKHIFKSFFTSGIHAILVFPHQTLWQYSDRKALTKASNAGGWAQIAILDQYLASSRVVNGPTAKCYTHSCASPWQVGDTTRW